MDRSRRAALKSAGLSGVLAAGFATGLLRPGTAHAVPWNKSAFEAKTTPEALKSLHLGAPTTSGDIVIKAPDIAENGALVPLDITSNIAGTQSLTLLIDKNPFPYVGTFDFSQGALPYIHVRVKMAETSQVRAIVLTATGQTFQASREVKVTIGGCGG